jgi:hypothetical protein
MFGGKSALTLQIHGIAIKALAFRSALLGLCGFAGNALAQRKKKYQKYLVESIFLLYICGVVEPLTKNQQHKCYE